MSDLESEINKRRTFAIISHPDAGKTTLTENYYYLVVLFNWQERLKHENHPGTPPRTG